MALARQTLAEYGATWLEDLPARGLRPSTVDGYRRCILYVTPALGGRRLDQVTALDLDRRYADSLKAG